MLGRHKRRSGRVTLARRGALLAAVLLVEAAVAVGCNTYRQDLDRAAAHYERNQYESALALFRVLEPDMDSLTVGDQARYAYLRGMTDYRLSSATAKGTEVSDPRQSYRDNARHWLAVASAIDKKSPGGLTPEEKTRLDETLADLNRDVFGGADAQPDGGALGADAGAAPSQSPLETVPAPATPAP
jgi:hypothetical protein